MGRRTPQIAGRHDRTGGRGPAQSDVAHEQAARPPPPGKTCRSTCGLAWAHPRNDGIASSRHPSPAIAPGTRPCSPGDARAGVQRHVAAALGRPNGAWSKIEPPAGDGVTRQTARPAAGSLPSCRRNAGRGVPPPCRRPHETRTARSARRSAGSVRPGRCSRAPSRRSA